MQAEIFLHILFYSKYVKMKKILTISLALLFTSYIFGQQTTDYWKQVEYQQIFLPEKAETVMMPPDYIFYSLDFDAVRNHLRLAPMEGTEEARAGALHVQLPLADGGMETFRVWESPVMHPDLAERYPMIKTYAGKSIENPAHVVRFGYGPDGFHAFIPSENGGTIIERYATEQTQYYIIYPHSGFLLENIGLPKLNLIKEDIENGVLDESAFVKDGELDLRGGGDGALTERRDYLFALACTGEYGQSHGGTISSVLSTLVTATNTLNSLLERDIDVRFTLHPDNDQLVFLNPTTDPYTNGTTGGALLGQNEQILNDILGIANYDVGHVYTGSCSDVGGVVSGTVCAAGKARGVTCNFSSNVIATTLSIAAHEIMHQFAGGHTFNHCPGQGGQFSSNSAREPGSGSTILSYQGACGPSNIPGPATVQYNAGSIDQVWTYTHSQGGNICVSVTETSNHSPIVTENYNDGFYIPISTPFELEVSATDADGDALTYSWEQWNRDPSAPLGQPFGNAPTFRVYDHNPSPKRIFPRLPVILANSSEIVEILPTYSREFEFRCVVRDNVLDEGAGGVTWADVSFKATDSAGPFRVTYPNTGSEVWKAGEEVEVTWDVANTDNNLVKCQSVNIWLSTNGGNSFNHLIVAATPNDGSETITVPDLVGSSVRLRIEASNNIFFDLSNQNFKIDPATEPTYSLGISPQYQQTCVPEGSMVEVSVGSISGFDQPVLLEITGGLPANAQVEIMNNPVLPGEAAILDFNMSDVVDDGLFEVVLQAIAGADTTYKTLFFNVVFNDFSLITLDGPVNGGSDYGLLPTFTWADLPQADVYDFQLSTSPNFEPGSIVDEVFDLVDASYISDVALQESKIYYWRVRPSNECGKGDYSLSNVFQTFTTECEAKASPDVPINISGIGLPVIESEVVVLQSGIISDVNIKNLSGVHNALADLRASVVSPAGTEVVLFENICGNITAFDLNLNDQSPFEIDCPPLNGLAYKPQEPLANFIGENTLGTWKLRVAVINDIGTGGSLQSWTIEFCASVTPEHPFLLENDTVYVKPSETRVIHNYELFAGDPDDITADLKVNIINETAYGFISKNGVPLGVGDFFRFTDINEEIITYTNTDPDQDYDFFTFTITDGQGGLLGTPRFNIVIDDDAVTSVDELPFNNEMVLYPNPATDQLNINFQMPISSDATVLVSDVQGRLIAQREIRKFDQQVQLGLDGYADGIYFLSVQTDRDVMTKRFVVQR